MMNTRYFRRTHILFLTAAAIGFGVLVFRPLGAVFLNCYPFITSDGFDWLVEGYALKDRICTGFGFPFHVLRDPGFLFVTALDDLLKANGVLVLGTSVLAFFLTGCLFVAAAKHFRTHRAVLWAVLVIYVVNPLNYFRLFVLADPLAVLLMTISALAMIRYLNYRSATSLAVSLVFMVLGGLTQTYAAIPFLVGSSIAIVSSPRERQPAGKPAVALATAAALLGASKFFWKHLIDHFAEPTTFGLLRLSFDMAGFYLNVWTLTFTPLLPVGFAAIVFQGTNIWRRSIECIFLCLVTATFMTLTFLYNWPEARFTFIYQPIVYMLLLCLAGARTNQMINTKAVSQRLTVFSAISCFAIVAELGFTPESLWQPRLNDLRWQPHRSWIGLAWSSRPVDRLGIATDSDDTPYDNAIIPNSYGPYPSAILRDFLLLRGLHRSRLCRPGEFAALSWSELRWRHDNITVGSVETLEIQPGYIELKGWAADLRNFGPISCLYIYGDKQLLATGLCGDSRPEINSTLKIHSRIRVGFSLSIPTQTVFNLSQVHVVAMFRDGTSQLLKSDTQNPGPSATP